jgi:uncharacterized protein YhbP (UPF0306 family)
MEPAELYDQFLAENFRMQLATSVDDQPWACTVSYIADKERNLYWASVPSRRHSQELIQNPKVAATIVVKGVLGQPVIGIQLIGTAEELSPTNYPRGVVEAYAEKFIRNPQWVDDFMNGNTEHRLYKITPAEIYLFDEENFPGGQRQKIL